jgi:Ca2+:H+ antiporter
VLIPLVSFAADGVLLTVYFIRSQFRGWLGVPDKPAGSLAETRAIDLSVQFLLFWTPALVLVGWALGKPMSLLFDLFEVMLLIAACFLLNHVTFDSRTNWAEGVMLVVFYLMIVRTFSIALAASLIPNWPRLLQLGFILEGETYATC